MTERGFFAVDRGFFEHPIFAPEPFTEREAFLWMIREAAYGDRRVRRGKEMLDLARGQLAHSLRFMATAWKWKSDARVRRFLNRLKTDAMVIIETTRETTRITICNYDRYQTTRRTERRADDAPTDARATHERRKQEQINKGTKEVINKKAQASRLPDDWQPSIEDIAYATGKGLSRSAVDYQAEKFRNYWHARAGPNAVKNSWHATWCNWILKALEDGLPNGNANGNHTKPKQQFTRTPSGASAQLAGAARLAQRVLGNVENRERDDLFPAGAGDGEPGGSGYGEKVSDRH